MVTSEKATDLIAAARSGTSSQRRHIQDKAVADMGNGATDRAPLSPVPPIDLDVVVG